MSDKPADDEGENPPGETIHMSDENGAMINGFAAEAFVAFVISASKKGICLSCASMALMEATAINVLTNTKANRKDLRRLIDRAAHNVAQGLLGEMVVNIGTGEVVHTHTPGRHKYREH